MATQKVPSDARLAVAAAIRTAILQGEYAPAQRLIEADLCERFGTSRFIVRAADICLDRGVFIETGPHKHAIQQTFFLYVYEPGGNRIELCNPVARLIFAPDWAPVSWTQAERAKGQAWGLATIPSFHTHGTPPVP